MKTFDAFFEEKKYEEYNYKTPVVKQPMEIFDISLKEIKAVMENPALERSQILSMQREMLIAKRDCAVDSFNVKEVAGKYKRKRAVSHS